VTHVVDGTAHQTGTHHIHRQVATGQRSNRVCSHMAERSILSAVFSIVQSVRPGPSDGTGLPVSSPFIARTGQTISARPSWTSDGTIYNLPCPSNLWTGTDGGRLPRHRKNSDFFGTQRNLRYLNNEATISRGSLAGAVLICYRAPPMAAIQWWILSLCRGRV
jgi:hypothetical protein